MNFERLMICFLLFYSVLKLTGFIETYKNILSVRRSKLALERSAKVMINIGSEEELRFFIKEQKSHLTDSTLSKCLSRLEELVEERIGEQKLIKVSIRPLN